MGLSRDARRTGSRFPGFWIPTVTLEAALEFLRHLNKRLEVKPLHLPILFVFNRGLLLVCLGSVLAPVLSAAQAPGTGAFQISGIYPHLAMFNEENECGTGAVVPWADRLWVITYAPHKPRGSTDRLYEITTDLQQIVRPESIGGTPANRFIHRESQQLFIGPYAIDAQRNVRVIPYEKMFGRPTGTARHLFDPANKIYYASMEEGFYEVDVRTLAVTELFRDEQLKEEFRRAALPGYHGKGLYSGQGVLVYANNGENSPLARQKPDIPSGALASWDGRSGAWTVVRRNQFTEVTGPGDIRGNENPATDPIWTIGWDHRSLILMVLDRGTWHSYRLPKASHSYDGAHGWNTEWPRIRDIGEKDLLMTMHGTFWRFPRTFSAANSAGLAPRSNYLKVVGDFARWQIPESRSGTAGDRSASAGFDRIVLGCDDTALSEFLNKRRAKGKLAAPGQSQSNLWFIAPEQLDQFGPAIGRGAVWMDDAVKSNQPSDAFMFSGYEQRMLHLTHDAGATVTFTLEVDRAGNNQWAKLRTVDVPANGYGWTMFTPAEKGTWIRVRASRDIAKATAFFSMRNRDRRNLAPDSVASGQIVGGTPVRRGTGVPPVVEPESSARFAGVMRDPSAKSGSGGLLHARGAGRKTLGFAATRVVEGRREASDTFYEMGPEMKLRRSDEAGALAWMQANVAIPEHALGFDVASVIYTDEAGKRFRLPRGRRDYTSEGPFGAERAVREVCTERDLLNCAGTFFELPAENAGGIAKLRPVATHNRRIHDFATWRGMLVISGIDANALTSNPHLIRSEDGRVAVWVGVVDDLWRFGRPVGEGGPWKETAVQAGQWSDPYLMTGYEKKTLTFSLRGAAQTVKMRVEVDLTGSGKWVEYAALDVGADKPTVHRFPDGFQAYWLRVSADRATTATAWLVYE